MANFTFNGIKGVIFDMDGTLADSMGIWKELDKKILKSFGVEMSDEFFAHICHMGLKPSCEYAVNYFNLPITADQMQEKLLDGVKRAYATTIQLKAGAKDFLLELKKRAVKISVATASGAFFFEDLAKNHSIIDLFDVICSVKDVGKDKSSPDIYLFAADKMGVSPSECVVFEDILMGITVAKNAGFKTVAIYESSSDTDREQIQKTAHFYARDFNDTLKILKQSY